MCGQSPTRHAFQHFFAFKTQRLHKRCLELTAHRLIAPLIPVLLCSYSIQRKKSQHLCASLNPSTAGNPSWGTHYLELVWSVQVFFFTFSPAPRNMFLLVSTRDRNFENISETPFLQRMCLWGVENVPCFAYSCLKTRKKRYFNGVNGVLFVIPFRQRI